MKEKPSISDFSGTVSDVLNSLKAYCEINEFKGWDPYDGLNSKIFQALPFKGSPFARLAWIQLFKRNPVNLRYLTMVPKDFNPKALGLFLSAYSNIYKLDKNDETRNTIIHIADQLIKLRSDGFSGTSWGYNFGWQARRLFYFPPYTPTVVATSYAAHGLIDAYEVTGCEKYLSTAINISPFITDDLIRTPKTKGIIFSYAPFEGNSLVYNASMLASRILSRIYSYTSDQNLLSLAKDSMAACCDAQNSNGSWKYGEHPVQHWIDSFHTGFNLESISDYQRYSGDYSFSEHLNKGFEFYISNFFTGAGMPKYYHNEIYPIDIHSPAQLIITLSKLHKLDQYEALLKNVLSWTLRNMFSSKKGFFYYQKSRYFTNRISYMRWSQAWMFLALTKLAMHDD